MLEKLIKQLGKARVLVIGDAMLDRYWYGGVERISPEAPVPVIAVNGSDERLGGAANVARNVTALGAQCTLLSITGDDTDAGALAALLDAAGVSHHLCRDPLISTTVKLRVISRNQQLIRIDFESPASHDTRRALLDAFSGVVDGFDVVIVSDYGKGGLAHVREIIAIAREHGKPVVVDPKGDDYSGYRGATLITPNRKEFEQVAGRFTTEDELVRKAGDMVQKLSLDGLLVTRGEEGMSLIGRDGKLVHMPARAREVFDVTGAGDTVIASVGCSYAAGAETEDALHLANVAAGIVVAKLGAATATPEEILAELKREES